MEQQLTPEHLQVLPELAILTTLDSVLQVTTTSLIAAYPELAEADRNPMLSCPPTAANCSAESLINLAAAMHDAIGLYRRATFHMINFVTRAGQTNPDF